MIHEFRHIVSQAKENRQNGLRSVLATVVALDGSSYRRPGVRMLIAENGQMTGAVSGGCVEKEVVRQTSSVFQTGESKVMAYDGRYRLGCKGTLYILLEPFEVSEEWDAAYSTHLFERKPLYIESDFIQKADTIGKFGSRLILENGKAIDFSPHLHPNPLPGLQTFSQKLDPPFRLIIVGAEHDSIKLCKQASIMGWEVEVICSLTNPKRIELFPGATRITPSTPDLFSSVPIGEHTAVVLMTHNYALDLQYLLTLEGKNLTYLGILGSATRREQLFNELFELRPAISSEFLELIHSPAGLNLGAETPEEIALSIVSEILSVIRSKDPFSLKEVNGSIHSS